MFQCRHRLSYNDGVLDSVRWYKVMGGGPGGREMVNFYTFMPGQLERERKQTKHRLQGINVLVCQTLVYFWRVSVPGFILCQ